MDGDRLSAEFELDAVSVDADDLGAQDGRAHLYEPPVNDSPG